MIIKNILFTIGKSIIIILACIIALIIICSAVYFPLAFFGWISAAKAMTVIAGIGYFIYIFIIVLTEVLNN